MLKKNIKVLLIENNRFDACIVQEMLTQEKNIKFKLKIVNCLSKGLMHLAKGKIDVVLLDFTLQKDKDISALSKIHTQAPQVAIVLQTILANKSTAVKTLQKGAQDYLIKDSFNSELLVRSLGYSVEKKNIENMLRESEEKFKKLEESANKPIILIGLKGNLLSLNNCAASDLGGKPKDYISKTLWDIFPKKVADERFKDHQKVIQSGRSNVKEITVSFKGIEYYYLARIQPIRNKSGDVNSVLILDNDITDRKKTEKALAESEERYRILFENTDTATIISEEDRTISMVNTQGEKLSGYSKEEIENKMKWTDFIIPEDLKRMKKYHIARRKAGKGPPTEYEFRMTDKKGNVKDIFSKIAMIPDTKKSIASFIDITERKQAEQATQESGNRFRELFKHMSSGVAIYEAKDNGKDFIFKDFNRAAEKIDKIKKKDIIGKSVLKAFPGVKDFGLFQVFQEAYKTGKPQHHPISLYKDQRITGWRENYVYKLPSGEIVAVYNDITERKKAEEKIKESEERLKILFDYAPDAYYISDLKGNFIDGNKAAERLIGYKRKELIGKSFLKLKLLSLADIPKAAKTLAKNIIGKPTGPDEFVLNRKDNSKVISEISTHPVKIKEKTLVLGIARDITEREKAEEALRESEKRLRIAGKVSYDLIYEWDVESNALEWFGDIDGLLGYRKGEISRDINAWLDLIHPEDRIKLENAVELHRTSTEPIQYEYRVRNKDNIYRHWKDNGLPLLDDKGCPYKWIGVCTDITERKKAIKEIEELAKFPTENPNPVLRISKDGTVLYHNHSSESLLEHWHYKEGKSLQDRWCQFVLDVLEDDDIKTVETEIGDKVISLTFAPIVKKDFVNVYGLDITERKQAEDNVKNAKDELQMIMDSVPAIIFYKDIEGRIIRANKILANSLHIPVKDIVGKTTEELFPKEQAEKMRKDDKEVIISGKPKRDIIESYDTPEGVRWSLTDKIPYRDKKGKITGVISLSKDITVQKKSEEKLQQSYRKLKKTMDATIDTMSKMIEAKDPYTSGHQHRVCQLAVRIAQEIKLPEDKIEGIRIASLIHDIGKIGLPTEILSKPTTLTDIEFSLIRSHSQIGYDILKSIDFAYPIAKIVLQHHERLNGSGYPNNLKGDEILLKAKIIGVADVVEAMSSHRPYRPALGIDKALEEISKNKTILYDLKVVDACIKLFKEKGFKF